MPPRAILSFKGDPICIMLSMGVAPVGALSPVSGPEPHSAPFCLPQKQLTQDDDADEVEIAIDNTAFMDEFFAEVGDRLECT